MTIFRLGIKNVIAKPLSTGLSLLLLSLGVGLISLMLHIDRHLREQMSSNIRGIDMVVGAKGSPLQLILSAVFQVDVPTGNIKLAEAENLLRNRLIDYGIPLSYGDSYQGFRIVGTDERYPENYSMRLAEGSLWSQSMEVAIGAAVAERTGLKLGDKFQGSHGLSEGGHVHESEDYVVTGIFEASGSVVDQLILSNLESVWDIHAPHAHEEEEHGHKEGEGHEHEEGGSHEHEGHEHAEAEEHSHEAQEHAVGEESDHGGDDREITALLIKFKNPLGLVQLPRMVNENTNMQAALPNYELNKLFSLMGIATTTLNLVALIVILVSGISVFISLYLSLRERTYEMALLRTFGASRGQLLGMVFQEGLLIAFSGFLLGLVFSRLGLWVVSLLLKAEYHYDFSQTGLVAGEGYLLLVTVLIGFLSALLPAISVYKIDISKSLSDA
ncbi:ABC transporter permease [Algoriphagus sp. H41]|uniref:ABC transporter permease n=1 Tax=Algoriphagus oliviformis TaxID=2811231 RepID=A0ABS3C6S2_9BACT|nr:ABC transporter permease [Algoriphagus oliviformis]MBN7811825.1 ABC transporter permease [Algoriphagus oliviformis]